jgi:hypothetical protein
MNRFIIDAIELKERHSKVIAVAELNPRALGQAMRLIRMMSGYTIKDVSEQMCVTLSYISQVELGKEKITNDRLAKYLEICK